MHAPMLHSLGWIGSVAHGPRWKLCPQDPHYKLLMLRAQHLVNYWICPKLTYKSDIQVTSHVVMYLY